MLKKILCMLVLVVITLNNTLFAISNLNDVLGEYKIYCDIDSEKYIYYDTRIQSNFDYYYINKNNIKMPAYCLNLGVPGAESMEDFYVNVNDTIKDKKLLNIMYNGYPYKTYKELGVVNEKQAKYATQFAVWAYLSKLDVNKIVETKSEYKGVKSAIKNIYYNGLNTKFSENNLVNVNISSVEVDRLDDNYLSCIVDLEYNDNIKDIKIKIENLENYVIANMQNNKIDISNTLNGTRKFKIMIPRENIKEDKTFNLNINYSTRENYILFGASKIPNMQNVSVNLEPITNKEIRKDINIKYKKVNFEIIKLDKENNKIKIPNTIFQIFNLNNNLLGEFKTDENGNINFDILNKLNIKNHEKIKIIEKEANDKYYLDKNISEKIIEINYDGENKVVFENEKIKGKIKIIKKSLDYNFYNGLEKNTLLKGAEFKLYDEEMNEIDKLVTNEKGEIITKDLIKGKYYIKEVKAPENYEISDKLIEVDIKEHGKILELVLYNKSIAKKELPKTGY